MSQQRAAETELQEALAQHKAGNASEAERLYRAVLCGRQDHSEANHNLGVLLIQRGAAEESLAFFDTARQADPSVKRYWMSHAKALLATGRSADALAVLELGRERGLSGSAFDTLVRQAQPVREDHAYAAATQHHQAGRFAQAAALYREVLTREPENADAHDSLGHALVSLGKLDEAVVAFRASAALRPDDAEFRFNLGYMLTMLGETEQAIPAYRQAVTLKPDFAEAHFRLGSLLCESGHVSDGFAHYMRRAELVYGSGRPATSAEPEPEHKRKHDREQRDYLAGGKAPPDAPAVADMFHLEDGGRLAGPAVNPANASPALLAQWRESQPQLVVIDDFLTPQALEKLRRYCAGSTIWRRIYQAGYIGATPQDGFACPLLAQIAEEIRGTFPEILAAHQLHYLGAFKYDSKLSTGTNTHADRSAVNVNFYIAPDESNLDPQSGGLDIWDVAVPAGEDMREYNADEARLKEFLRRSNAKVTRIPHRANRAVIFRSDLFHKTSDCRFQEGYLNKRINVSLLFGQFGASTR